MFNVSVTTGVKDRNTARLRATFAGLLGTSLLAANLLATSLLATSLIALPAPALAQTPTPAPGSSTAVTPKPKRALTPGQIAARDRQTKCAAEWKEAKAAGKVEKDMKWPKYWSACNKRLKGASSAQREGTDA